MNEREMCPDTRGWIRRWTTLRARACGAGDAARAAARAPVACRDRRIVSRLLPRRVTLPRRPEENLAATSQHRPPSQYTMRRLGGYT